MLLIINLKEKGIAKIGMVEELMMTFNVIDYLRKMFNFKIVGR